MLLLHSHIIPHHHTLWYFSWIFAAKEGVSTIPSVSISYSPLHLWITLCSDTSVSNLQNFTLSVLSARQCVDTLHTPLSVIKPQWDTDKECSFPQCVAMFVSVVSVITWQLVSVIRTNAGLFAITATSPVSVTAGQSQAENSVSWPQCKPTTASTSSVMCVLSDSLTFKCNLHNTWLQCVTIAVIVLTLEYWFNVMLCSVLWHLVATTENTLFLLLFCCNFSGSHSIFNEISKF